MLREILRSEYGIDPLDLEPLQGGRVNRLWKSGPLVVKVYDEARVSRDRACEVVRRQSELAVEGLPVPAPVPTLRGRLWADSPEGMVVVMPLLPGERRIRGSLDVTEAAGLGAALGGLHEALRSLEPSLMSADPGAVALPPQPAAISERWANLKKLAASVAGPTEFDNLVVELADYASEALARAPALDWSAQRWQVCHGDMHLDNILFDRAGGVAGILDFDNSGPSWAGAEVMMAWNLCLCSDPGSPTLSTEAAAFFSQYRRITRISADALAALPRLYWHTLVSNTWPASMRYRDSSLCMPEWTAILALRLRAARWLDENRRDMVAWLTS